MNPWSQFTSADVSIEPIAALIRTKQRPVHINLLAQAAVRVHLETAAGQRAYAPGSKYAAGETIRLDDQTAIVQAVHTGSNPRQGCFSILTLVLPDHSKRYLAAEVKDAPTEQREPVSDASIMAALNGKDGPVIRNAVQDALAGNRRFAWFQDAQGDHWCLTELLPAITDDHLVRVLSLLPDHLIDGETQPRPTADLARHLWALDEDGSPDYDCHAFALNASLQACSDLRWVGAGWVREDLWQQLQQRPALVGPRQPNAVQIPALINLDSTPEPEDGPGSTPPPAPRPANPEDFEAWSRNRLLNAAINLTANNYYANYLTLTADLRRVFPPFESAASQVTLHYYFGGAQGTLPAWVDNEHRRILSTPAMHDALQQHGIYPGAKLVVSHRGNLTDYDIHTNMIQPPRRVRVRRVFLSDDGALEYDDGEQPLAYEAAEDLFVADARWDDLPALIAQAEQVGAGIFQLMWEWCVNRWEQSHRAPLHVTVDDLFNAIHFDNTGRLTSKATIAWELWRRLAFLAAGHGRYLFRPEKGSLTREVGLRPPAPTSVSDPPKRIIRTKTITRRRPRRPPETTRTGPFFVLQQRPGSEYADTTGKIYNWRAGIPGSTQLVSGSRFVYYRPGDQVFFGTGRIASIDTYVDADGVTHYNGLVTDYEPWDPVLRLTSELRSALSFVTPAMQGVGQPGIRKITTSDFDLIIQARRRLPGEHTPEPPPKKPTDRQSGTTQPNKPWCDLQADPDRFTRLEAAVEAYMTEHLRLQVLALRCRAHQRIRELVALDHLLSLTLDDFNRHIWQIGSIWHEGQRIRIDSGEAEEILRRLDARQVDTLSFEGNQTWGSGSHVIGSRLGKSETEIQQLVRDMLILLLHSGAPIEERLSQLIEQSTGFGINSVTGILLATHPGDHILYNRRSVDALQALGVWWPDRDAHLRSYFLYRDFCQHLRQHFGLESLADVDWLMYCLATGRVTTTRRVADTVSR